MRSMMGWLKSVRHTARGQSLVEMAIAAPLLIFLMIGVFEVGWALRGYLVLVNANREITRYAVRPGYMNFSTITEIQTSFDRVRGWVDTTLSKQLEMRFGADDPNSTLIISHIVIDTGVPCKDINDPDCEPCSKLKDPDHNPFPQDDIIIHPQLPNFTYQTATFGIARPTQLNYTELVRQSLAQNNESNCDIIKKGGIPSATNMIVTELFYDQPQLFGFPFISNPLTDPIPMYSHTAMRLADGSRGMGIINLTEGISTLGPVCFAFPMVINATEAVDGSPQNILKYGWLKWNGGTSVANQEYLDDTLRFPQMSLTDFVDANGTGKLLSIGSQVSKMPAGTQPDETLTKSLVSRRLIIPVTTSPIGSVSVEVTGFVWATITTEDAIDLSSSPASITATIQTTDLPAPCQLQTPS